MKVGLINTYSYNNIGDAAIYAALSKLLEGYSVYSTLKDKTGQIPKGLQESNELTKLDKYISVGGDIFNNSRPWFITKKFLQNLHQLNKSPKATMLFGQSIPASCNGLALKLLSHQLKKLGAVVVRDQKSYQLLKKQGVNCSLSYDTAFILNCSHSAVNYAAEILTSMQVTRSAVISLREFNALYPVDNESFIRNITVLCKRLSQHNYQPVLVIQSNVSELDTDRLIANAIKQQCREVKILDLFEYSKLFPTWELLQAILKISRLIIAVRYHTAVLALAAGRTPFNLFYSNKGADLTHRLGIPGCHIEQFNPYNSFARIEQTGYKTFDSSPLVESVYDSFYQGFERCHLQDSLGENHELA
jgi:polysaccharide pyruvyl transferase WcaK-like protein